MIDKSLSPKVGVQILVVKDGNVLIGKDARKGEDLYGVPGGHWENGETLKEAAKREVLEESGIECGDIKFLCVYDFFREDKGVSYVSISYVAKFVSGDLKDNQTEGRVDWRWMDPHEALKLNLYPAGRALIEAFLKNN